MKTIAIITARGGSKRIPCKTVILIPDYIFYAAFSFFFLRMIKITLVTTAKVIIQKQRICPVEKLSSEVFV